MADLYSDGALGEDILKNAKTEVVEYNATITAGQLLKGTAVNAAGQPVVVVADAGSSASHVAMYSGVATDIKKALVEGLVKVTFGTTTTINGPVKAGATGKAVSAVNTVTVPTGGAGTGDGGALTVEGGIACGKARQASTGDGDTGLIYFVGAGGA